MVWNEYKIVWIYNKWGFVFFKIGLVFFRLVVKNNILFLIYWNCYNFFFYRRWVWNFVVVMLIKNNMIN